MSALAVEVRQATIEDLDVLTPLFDGYRQFYRQASDMQGARRFLRDRFEHNQSVLFLALADGVACGFTQLYPSFSSTGMARIFVLNDLFVVPAGRGRGTGRALLEAAAVYGRRVGALRLGLSTEVNNTTAQRLYEGMGWKRDSAFYSYQLTL